MPCLQCLLPNTAGRLNEEQRWAKPAGLVIGDCIWNNLSIKRGGESGLRVKVKLAKQFQLFLEAGQITGDSLAGALIAYGKRSAELLQDPSLLDPFSAQVVASGAEPSVDIEIESEPEQASSSGIAFDSLETISVASRERTPRQTAVKSKARPWQRVIVNAEYSVLLPDTTRFWLWQGGSLQEARILQRPGDHSVAQVFLDWHQVLNRCRGPSGGWQRSTPNHGFCAPTLDFLRDIKAAGAEIFVLSYAVDPAKLQDALRTLESTPGASDLFAAFIATTSKTGALGKKGVLQAFKGHRLLLDVNAEIVEEAVTSNIAAAHIALPKREWVSEALNVHWEEFLEDFGPYVRGWLAEIAEYD